MTVEQVRERVAKLAANADCDPESAHADKDDLYLDLLRWISIAPEQERGPYPGKTYSDNHELIVEALKAEEIKMRWSACA